MLTPTFSKIKRPCWICASSPVLCPSLGPSRGLSSNSFGLGRRHHHCHQQVLSTFLLFRLAPGMMKRSTFSPGFADFCRLCHDAVSFYFFSTVSCPFQPEVPSNLQLLCPILSISTCHSCYTSACTAFSACTFTAMPLASTNLTLFCLISKVLHKATFTSGSFTQTLFYTKHFLPKPTFRPTNFYTNPLLNKLAFPQTTFHTNQLLHKPCFGPVGQRPESRQNAKGCWAINMTKICKNNV